MRWALLIVAAPALSGMPKLARRPSPPPPPPPGPPAPIQIYGAWHCSDDYCTWGRVRSLADFDAMNHWLIDRGDRSGRPSVNVVVLSFVNPLDLLNQTASSTTDAFGVPMAMTPQIVQYFTSRDIRVMVSIGGITYADDWNAALAQDGGLLGLRAADPRRRDATAEHLRGRDGRGRGDVCDRESDAVLQTTVARRSAA